MLFGSALWAAIACIVLGIYVLPGIGYFLPLGFLGGYDKNTLEDFKTAVELSGPSKLIIKLWLKGASLGAKFSFLHDKFPMYYDNVGKEIEELSMMKMSVDTKGNGN